jgi:hypothetical protein
MNINADIKEKTILDNESLAKLFVLIWLYKQKKEVL